MAVKYNFECDCGKQVFIPTHKSVLVGTEFIYKDNYGKELLCECGNKLKSLSQFTGELPYFGKVGSMNTEEKRNMLKKRSSDHFNREIKEKKHEMERDMKNNLLGK